MTLRTRFPQEHSFTDGRIFLVGNRVKRKQTKRADFLLQYTRDFTIAVVEAKSEDKPAGEGLQQAKEYADILSLKFAYATNGHQIIEFDYLTGQERVLEVFPSPEELWLRYTQAADLQPEAQKTLLEPYNQTSGKNSTVLPADCHQSCGPIRAEGTETDSAHHGHRDWKDGGGVQHCLEALAVKMESDS